MSCAMSRTTVCLTSLLLSGISSELQHLNTLKTQKTQLLPLLNNDIIIKHEEEEIPSFEIMDFYVPSYPFSGLLVVVSSVLTERVAGDSIEISCGYSVSGEFLLRRLEWYRVTHNHKVLLVKPSQAPAASCLYFS